MISCINLFGCRNYVVSKLAFFPPKPFYDIKNIQKNDKEDDIYELHIKGAPFEN